MPIAICSGCKKPIPDSFHYFDEVCDCVDWVKKEKRMGWKLHLPKRDNIKAKEKDKKIICVKEFEKELNKRFEEFKKNNKDLFE